MSAIDTHAPEPGGHAEEAGHGHDHPPFLAHHWDTPQQQFEAGKLGMWLFLATEFLLFGGLFAAYAVYRHNHPALFEYGAQFLSVKYGGTNTAVLILSSLTMAMAVSAAQLGRRKTLIVLLALTFCGGAGFMCIKYIEYKAKFEDNIVWGTTFYEPPKHGEGDPAAAAADPGESHDEAADPEAGHAAEQERSDADASSAEASDAEEEPAVEDVEGLLIPRSALPRASEAPQGLVPEAERQKAEEGHAEAHEHGHPDPRTDPNRPPNAHIFFGLYFCMTGLHGLHVLVGMSVIAWLIVRAAKGHFSAEYFTPVDLGGLYWHVVDVIWIFLFPLLYLIH
jgi:cytochrome c oxidase subunit 3